MSKPVVLPQAYIAALANRFTSDQVDAFISSSGKPNFVYGSLMFPSVIANVTGSREIDRASKMARAVLRGYQRYGVKNAHFPAVMASEDPKHSVEGIMVFDLDKEQRASLDRFESGLYTEESVQIEITLRDGETRMIDGIVYIWGGGRDELHEVEESLWTVDDFIKSDSYQMWC
ncbi:MAG: hypothetical protein M1812_004079 [Candelaria pacifica]|nr:MAG: hypothetical protein M1812_004079 [Candelaria pacifica]